jgi:selenocysteine lyase/cysteine desulfurase
LHQLSEIGMGLIQTRLMILTEWLLTELQGLTHSNGTPVAVVYGPKHVQARGPTILFNLVDPNGVLADGTAIEQHANLQGISLRTGCLLNAGGPTEAVRASLGLASNFDDCFALIDFLKQQTDLTAQEMANPLLS